MWFIELESSGEGAGDELEVIGIEGDGGGGNETTGELAGGWLYGDGVIACDGDGDGDGDCGDGDGHWDGGKSAGTWSERVSRKIERNDNVAFSIGEKMDLKDCGKCLKENG
jgi:hypothetical protein